MTLINAVLQSEIAVDQWFMKFICNVFEFDGT